MGPFCNGEPDDMITWLDSAAVDSDEGLSRAPMWLTIELLPLLLLLLCACCCAGGDIDAGSCALLP